MKICGSCKQELGDLAFGVRKASKDGLAARCKHCQSVYDKTRANAPHRVKAREQYQNTERGRKAGNEAKRRYTERNAIKRGAHILLGNAIRDGKVDRPSSCESCGSKPFTIHGHHDDYALPLVVRWLCPGCHCQWHKQNGEGKNSH